MTNEQVLEKMSKDMQMRNFSHYTYYSYMHKGKEIIDYFDKPIEEVTTEKLRNFLYEYLINERKLSDRSVNYYNSIIRFMYEVTMDKLINKKQLPMRKKKKEVYKVLAKEELSTFFNCVDDYKFKTIFMLAYGSGLRIGEIVNLHISDIDSKKMRIFLTELDEPMTVGVIRERFRRYRRKAGLNEKVTMHTLRHCYATNLIENGATITVTNASQGIVMIDSRNNEWVWIEIPKTVFTTATKADETDKIKADLIAYASTYRKGSASQSYSWTDEWYDGCGIADSSTYTETYNKMLRSVYTNGGFWISRYEIGDATSTESNTTRTSSSGITGTAVSKENQIPYNFSKVLFDATKINPHNLLQK